MAYTAELRVQATYDALAAAGILRVSKMTIIRWCRSGKLEGAYLIRRSRRLGWQIPTQSVHNLLEAQERGTLQEHLSA